MGQGGYLTLVNDTDRQWTRTHQHSYQMHWDFPEKIPAGTAHKVYVEWDQGLFTTVSDDAAEARYTLDGTEMGFEVQARAKNGFVLQVLPVNLPTRDLITLGWKHDGVVWFGLRGSAEGLTISTKDEWADVPLADWMSRLDGSLRLSELTLPGTHDTCARNCSPFSWTQNLTVRQQLNMGIRFLDIRCRHVRNAFAIHHAQEFLDQWFDAVRDDCYAFLSEHPRETIVMMVKQEHTDEENTRSYQETFGTYTQAAKDNWYLGDRIPTLDEVRGKIVLFRRFPADTTPMGIDAWGDSTTNWMDDGTFVMARNGVTLRVQDNYNVSLPVTIAQKWDRVEKHIGDALQGERSDWYLNYLSGSGWDARPLAIAIGTSPTTPGMNDRLYRRLRSSSPGRYGTLLLDFAEHPGELVRTLVSLNRISG